MKSILTAAFVAIACSPVLASEPTAPPSAPPAEAPTTAVEATTATPSAPVQAAPKILTRTLPVQSANQYPSFCGQDTVLRLLEKTELDRQLYLRQQEALRAAIAQAAPTEIKPAQPAPEAPTETTLPGTTSPQE